MMKKFGRRGVESLLVAASCYRYICRHLVREEGRQRGNRLIIRDSSIKSIILVSGYLIVIRDSSIPKIHNSGACLPDSDSSIYLRSIILVPGYLDTLAT